MEMLKKAALLPGVSGILPAPCGSAAGRGRGGSGVVSFPPEELEIIKCGGAEERGKN